jgi:hypothetical protein
MSWLSSWPVWQLRRAAGAVLIGGESSPTASPPATTVQEPAELEPGSFAALVAEMDQVIIEQLAELDDELDDLVIEHLE